MSFLSKSNQLNEFQRTHTFEKRSSECTRLLSKYPDRSPVVCEIARNSKDLVLTKTKFLVPRDLTIGHLLAIIRKHITGLNPAQSIFLFTEKGTLPMTSQIIGSIVNEHKNLDGFLYLTVSGENTFG